MELILSEFNGEIFLSSLETEGSTTWPNAFRKVITKIRVNPISKLSTGKYLSLKRM